MNREGFGSPLSFFRVSMGRLEVNLICDTTREQVIANIESCYKRGYPILQTEQAHDGVVSLCGAAPSMKDTIGELKGDVWAVNSAHNYLISCGVVPDVGFFWDAGTTMLQHLNNPHKDVHYYVATHCAPEVFDRLDGYKVTVFHAEIGYNIQPEIEAMNWIAPIYHGGSAGATRMPFIAYGLGYREIHLHGADASFDENTHVNWDMWDQFDNNSLEVTCYGRTFKTIPCLSVQAKEIPRIAETLVGARIIPHGDGLLQHVARMHGL